MKNQTRIAYAAYLTTVASLNGVASATEKFTVAPSVQQTLEDKIQESSGFLASINVIGVTDQSGEKIGLGIGGTIAGTTDTSAKDRTPVDPSSLEGSGYECTQTNFDTALKYAKIDMWAKFPDFQTRMRDAIVKRQALDRILIGFNGVSRAKTSDRAANPLLQDVNIGWLQKYRTEAPARVMKAGYTANQVRVGVKEGADYANLDALVFDAVNNLVDPVHQEDTELVVICGRNLLADKYFPILNQAQANTEAMAADLIISQKRIGGLQAVRVPGFPANTVMVTRLDNLSIYYQEGARRRTVVDNAKRDQVENYESSNDAYVVEDYSCGCVVENITLDW
jgi:P2 family phage major capsid protein